VLKAGLKARRPLALEKPRRLQLLQGPGETALIKLARQCRWDRPAAARAKPSGVCPAEAREVIQIGTSIDPQQDCTGMADSTFLRGRFHIAGARKAESGTVRVIFRPGSWETSKKGASGIEKTAGRGFHRRASSGHPATSGIYPAKVHFHNPSPLVF